MLQNLEMLYNQEFCDPCKTSQQLSPPPPTHTPHTKREISHSIAQVMYCAFLHITVIVYHIYRSNCSMKPNVEHSHDTVHDELHLKVECKDNFDHSPLKYYLYFA